MHIIWPFTFNQGYHTDFGDKVTMVPKVVTPSGSLSDTSNNLKINKLGNVCISFDLLPLTFNQGYHTDYGDKVTMIPKVVWMSSCKVPVIFAWF
jgi:hypothetical protein